MATANAADPRLGVSKVKQQRFAQFYGRRGASCPAYSRKARSGAVGHAFFKNGGLKFKVQSLAAVHAFFGTPRAL